MKKKRKDELSGMIEDMRATSAMFYMGATGIGNHPFIEFTGLMNEYIDLCQGALSQGVDFTECNIHTGLKLPMHDYQKKYASEKIECIYSGQLKVVA